MRAIAGLAAVVVCGLAYGEGHEHGVARLDIAMEGKRVKAELEAPAESIFGFEREARTKEEKRAVEEALAVLRRSGEAMLKLPAEAGCRIVSGRAEMEGGGTHKDVVASYEAECARPVRGGEIVLSIGERFPRIKRLKVQVVGEGVQTGAELAGGRGRIRLGR